MKFKHILYQRQHQQHRLNDIKAKLYKLYRHLLYTVRASMLLYVAYMAFAHQIYFLAIAFAYFAFVDFSIRYKLSVDETG